MNDYLKIGTVIQEIIDKLPLNKWHKFEFYVNNDGGEQLLSDLTVWDAEKLKDVDLPPNND